MIATCFSKANPAGKSTVGKFPDINAAKSEALRFMISKIKEGFKLKAIDQSEYENFVLSPPPERKHRYIPVKKDWTIRYRDELKKAYLIFHSSDNKKFWHIRTRDNRYTTVSGQIGKNSTSATKVFKDSGSMVRAARTLMEAKEKAGYTKQYMVRTRNTFANKPIEIFDYQSLYPNAAVKLVGSFEGMYIHKQMELLTKFPNFTLLDTLVIGRMVNQYAIEVLLEKLVGFKNSFSNLKHLFVGDISLDEIRALLDIIQTDYTNFYQHFPNLESFGVRGSQYLVLGKIELPKLKRLIVETTALQKETIQDICNSDLPNLEHLDIWLSNRYGSGNIIEPEDMMPILNNKFPSLKYLGLKNYDRQDDLVKILSGAKVLKNLEVLDISMSILTDEGAQALYHNNDLLKLKHINCRYHYISEEWRAKLKAKFANQNINLMSAQVPDKINGKLHFLTQIGD